MKTQDEFTQCEMKISGRQTPGLKDGESINVTAGQSLEERDEQEMSSDLNRIRNDTNQYLTLNSK